MRFVGYLLSFLALWVLCVFVWKRDLDPPYCELTWWPSRGRHTIDIAMETPAAFNARSGAPRVFFVDPKLPFFCASLRSLKVQPMVVLKQGAACEGGHKCPQSKGSVEHNPKPGQPLFEAFSQDEDTPRQAMKALRRMFRERIEPRLHAHRSHESFSLVLRNERFRTTAPEGAPDTATDALTPCFALPPGRRSLRTDRLYRLKEKARTDTGVRTIYLWPVSMAPLSWHPTPQHKPYFFQHYGRCMPHLGFDFGIREKRLLGVVPRSRSWVRWTLRRRDTRRRIALKDGQKASLLHRPYRHYLGGKSMSLCPCLRDPVYQIVGYPPVLSSMWMPDLPLGTPLQLELQAVHPFGVSASTQRVHFRWQAPHGLQKGSLRVAGVRLFFRVNHRVGWWLLLALQGALLLFWWLRRRRAAEPLPGEATPP